MQKIPCKNFLAGYHTGCRHFGSSRTMAFVFLTISRCLNKFTERDLITVKKFKAILSVFGVISAALLLSGCKLALLDPKGIIAASEKQLMIDATLLMLIVVIPVILITFWFVWRYRASNKNATYRPDDHHSTAIEVVCWAIPCIIILILGTMTWISSHRLDPYRPLKMAGKPITIQAIALNWKWLFIYPDQKIATINYVQIPVNRQIRFLITSDAPMNSLLIPRLAGQIYAMGGMRTQLHLAANQIGVYRGFSSNFSGGGFSGMHFKVHVTSQQDYNAWVNKTKRSPQKLTIKEYNKLMQDSENNPVQFFSGVANNLFKNVIMKYMMPNVKGMYTVEEQRAAQKGN
jgi:cytochrome o ubiquinol oxidase subunit 2